MSKRRGAEFRTATTAEEPAWVTLARQRAEEHAAFEAERSAAEAATEEAADVADTEPVAEAAQQDAATSVEAVSAASAEQAPVSPMVRPETPLALARRAITPRDQLLARRRLSPKAQPLHVNLNRRVSIGRPLEEGYERVVSLLEPLSEFGKVTPAPQEAMIMRYASRALAHKIAVRGVEELGLGGDIDLDDDATRLTVMQDLNRWFYPLHALGRMAPRTIVRAPEFKASHTANQWVTSDYAVDFQLVNLGVHARAAATLNQRLNPDESAWPGAGMQLGRLITDSYDRQRMTRQLRIPTDNEVFPISLGQLGIILAGSTYNG